MIEKPGIRQVRLRRLLHRLIDIYSPSGKEEELLTFLASYLKRQGLPVVRQMVDANRFNLVVIPPGIDPRCAFIGHVDTVVAYDFDHLGHEDRRDEVIGLGAADMKGGCAAMIEAYISHWKSSSKRAPVALALVVGEEEEGDGAERLVRDFAFPWAIIGEPTNLTPCLSHYGYLEVQLTTSGKRVHASLANSGQTPVEIMLRFLLKLSGYMEVSRPEVVYNIRDLASSHRGFAVPDRCDAWVDVHLPPTTSIEEIASDLEALVGNGDLQGNRPVMRFTIMHRGYALPDKGRVIDDLRTVMKSRALKWEPQPFRSHSDANLLWSAGTRPVLLGPGLLEKAHAPDESVSFSQVLTAAGVYHDFLLALSA